MFGWGKKKCRDKLPLYHSASLMMIVNPKLRFHVSADAVVFVLDAKTPRTPLAQRKQSSTILRILLYLFHPSISPRFSSLPMWPIDSGAWLKSLPAPSLPPVTLCSRARPPRPPSRLISPRQTYWLNMERTNYSTGQKVRRKICHYCGDSRIPTVIL